MRRHSFIAAWVVVALAGMFVLAACDDEPTVPEANKDFCDSVGNFTAALRDLRDIDSNSTIEEYEAARDQAIDTYDAMIEASVGVTGARIDQVEKDRDALQNAIDDVPSDATFNEALDSVDNEIEDLAKSVGQLLNNVDCGDQPGGGSQSDE